MVSTDFPAARAIGEEYVKVAKTEDEFVYLVEEALSKDSKEQIEKRRAKARENSWVSRAETMSGFIINES